MIRKISPWVWYRIRMNRARGWWTVTVVFAANLKCYKSRLTLSSLPLDVLGRSVRSTSSSKYKFSLFFALEASKRDSPFYEIFVFSLWMVLKLKLNSGVLEKKAFEQVFVGSVWEFYAFALLTHVLNRVMNLLMNEKKLSNNWVTQSTHLKLELNHFTTEQIPLELRWLSIF